MPINPYVTRRPSRPPIDALTIFRDKNTTTPIVVTTQTATLQVQLAHLDKVQAIVYANAYTGYVKDVSEWRCDFECAMTAAGPYKVLGSSVLRSAADGTNASIVTTGEMIQNLMPNGEFYRVNAVKVGNPGPLMFGAYLAPEEDQ